MQYRKTVTLKDGGECVLRNGTEKDGQALLDIFNLTHAQTDFLLTYPGEGDMTVEQEAEFLRGKTESENAYRALASPLQLWYN